MSVLAQVAQVGFILLVAPLYKGYMDRLRARGMRRIGPPVVQPYRDLWKWLHKETVQSEYATGFATWVPVLYFSAPVIVTLLIPVLTTFPLPLAFMADMFGGGMILGAGGFLLLFASMETGSPYTGIGVSRIRLIGTFAEPLTVMAVFAAASVGHSTLPFTVTAAFAAQNFFRPDHLLVILAFVLLVLAEGGRLPVDNPDSVQELSMIDPNRVFEFSGVDLALVEWGGWMKFTVLSVILVNVLVTPWGLAHALTPWILVAAAATALKLLALGALLTVVELSFSKLRLMRISEYLTYALAVAVVAALASSGL